MLSTHKIKKYEFSNNSRHMRFLPAPMSRNLFDIFTVGLSSQAEWCYLTVNDARVPRFTEMSFSLNSSRLWGTGEAVNSTAPWRGPSSCPSQTRWSSPVWPRTSTPASPALARSLEQEPTAWGELCVWCCSYCTPYERQNSQILALCKYSSSDWLIVALFQRCNCFRKPWNMTFASVFYPLRPLNTDYDCCWTLYAVCFSYFNTFRHFSFKIELRFIQRTHVFVYNKIFFF